MRHRVFIRVPQHDPQPVRGLACHFGAEHPQPFGQHAAGRTVALVQHQGAWCGTARQFANVQPVQCLACRLVQAQSVRFEPSAIFDAAFELPNFRDRTRAQNLLSYETGGRCATGDNRTSASTSSISHAALATSAAPIRTLTNVTGPTPQVSRSQRTPAAMLVEPCPEAAGFVVFAAEVTSPIVLQP